MERLTFRDVNEMKHSRDWNTRLDHGCTDEEPLYKVVARQQGITPEQLAHQNLPSHQELPRRDFGEMYRRD